RRAGRHLRRPPSQLFRRSHDHAAVGGGLHHAELCAGAAAGAGLFGEAGLAAEQRQRGHGQRHPAHRHLGCGGGGDPGPLHPLGHARSAGPALYPRGLGQGPVVAALAWIALMLVVAVGADWLAPYSFSALDLKARLLPPVGFGGVWRHGLGTDELGRDVLSRLIVSIRISLLIAFFGTLIAATLGTTLGFLAAHFRRR